MARDFSACLFVVAFSALMTAQTDHPVDIGRNQRLAFTDNQSGTNISFVNPGDTVTWKWVYSGIGHSTTSSVCTPTVPGSCPPNGIWDSTILFFGGTPPNPTFTRTFNTLGTFPYFCEVHGEPDGMRGQVVVTNGPDFALDLTSPGPFDSSTFTVSTFATQTIPFSSTNNSSENSKLVAGFGYNSPVTLSCGAGGPDTCPGLTMTPKADGSSIITSGNFPVSHSTFGDFDFPVVATGSDPNHITHSIQHLRLHVTDFSLSPLSVDSVVVPPGTTSAPITFQVIPSSNGFIGRVTLSCSGLPAGTTCTFIPSAFVDLFGGFSKQISLIIDNSSASGGTFQVKVEGVFDLVQSLVRSQSITLQTGPTHFSLSAPATTIIGFPFSVTAAALDDTQQVVTGYTGTVQFTSSDGAATLPANFTFSGVDHGTHTFANDVTLNTVGSRTVAITDISTLITGTSTISVIPADHLKVQVLPSTNVASGAPFSIVVTAVDAAGNPVPRYADTIHFAISDAAASGALPSDYTFTGPGGDNGTHSFNLTLNKIEPVTITVTDLSFAGLSVTSPLILVGNGSFDGLVTLASSRVGQAPPHFAVGAKATAKGSVSFTATVNLNSGDPAGIVRFFDGPNELGTASLTPVISGTATATYTINGTTQQLRPGSHTIVSVYEPTAGTGSLAVISQPRSPAPLCHGGRCP